MDADARRARTAVSALLLALGAFAFVVSLSLPGVTQNGRWGRMHLDGWTCAVSYGPTGANNVFLAAAFVIWGFVVWFRSIWAYWLGAIFAAVTTLLFGTIGAWPGFERIERLHSGYYVWVASSFAVLLAFLLLPAPDRVPQDEALARAEIDRGRARLAAIFGLGATVVLLVTHFLVPMIAAHVVIWRAGRNDAAGTYETGPATSSGSSSVQIKLSSGNVVEVQQHSEHVTAPVAEAQFGHAASGVHEFAVLTLPLLFAAAAATRRRLWRWTGAALAAGLVVSAVFLVTAPWSVSSFGMHPLEVAWWGVPSAFVVAFALLPPARTT